MNKAEQLIACLEGEIAKRDARIVELQEKTATADDADFNLRGLLQRGAFALGLDPENTSWFEVVGNLEQQSAELAALKAQDTVGEVVGWYRLDRPYEMTSYPSVCATWHKLGAPVAPLNAAPVQQVSVPDGYVLVPQRMELTPADIASIMFHCGGDEEATEVDEMFVGGVLWVGDIKDDDDNLVHGLHIATADYPEEGSTTLVEFAAPAAPAADAGVTSHD